MNVPRFLILNFLTKRYLKEANKFPVSLLSSRLKSMVTDLWFTIAIVMPLFLLVLIPFLVFMSEFGDKPDIMRIYILVPWLIFLFIVLNKDCVNGMSAAKRTFGFKIIDYRTKESASDFQCMIRNSTMYLWPLEVLMAIVYPRRRIGDFLARTEVVKTDVKPIESLITELHEKQNFSLQLILATLGVSVLLNLIAYFDMI